ncbi:MAG: cell division protein FtsI (penicillin-binding protein 3) [bacterium]|nr:MAG: cell division protein FtsI (penicillin-binding protein 3) [bacterium]KAF0150138.1 MAG: cell division protein FtsI (penicillin-binding protein 3) [bacterium]KAF0169618.1 MAG: cell division protein FtsI (penicillin-binding protein 3) [bacterium]TXT22990.1 MAG: cell division protein FtsI (penicillin-binding protein 3) [bacterium]
MRARHATAAHPLLHLDLQRWRMRLTLALLFAGFAALTARAVYLQVWQSDFLTNQGEKRAHRVESIPAYRGVITDRRGEPLAVSTPVETLWANPREASPDAGQIQALAHLLEKNPDQLRRLFADKSKAFVYLERLVEPARAERVKALGISGVYGKPEFRRYYPAGEVTAHVLGITNIEDQGQEGLELSYQAWLAGEPGAQRVVKDRPGNVVEVLERLKAPKPGRDLVLSLNQHIQYLAYRELNDAMQQHQARAGSVVVLDAKTGEVLALANSPSFNPNSRATFETARLRNRAVTDTFEPGSTMKPLFVAAALDAGVVNPETRIDTGPGWFIVGDRRITDVHPKGVMSISDAIQVSSNVALAKVALDMRGEDYWKVLSRAGLGTPPKSGMPGEVGGRLRPYTSWRPIEKATMSYGHGLSLSLLQLARAYTAFANDGVMPAVTTLRREGVATGTRVMSAESARQVLAMLERVTEDGGTAPNARVAGYRIAGKTGTAHKFVDGAYARNRYISSFVGLAPASNPRLVVAVMIDEPTGRVYYGGLVAAPVFSRVMAGALRFMAVPPDAPFSQGDSRPEALSMVPEST